MGQGRKQWKGFGADAMRLAATAVVAFGAIGAAQAFQIDTGNPDVSMRWDNTLRYNAGWRMENRDTRIIGNAMSDEGDMKFGKNDLVTNRFDLLSEFDYVYKKDTGFRVSAAAWYDNAYKDAVAVTNPALATPSSYQNGQYSNYTRRWYQGSGEILDAFVFANMDLGGTPLNVRVGQHTVTWGQALFYAGGISFSQSPLDYGKALANPGIELKELFLPLKQISFQSQVSPEWSIMGQYFLDWKPFRTPEGGTYLSAMDFTVTGPNGLVLPNYGLYERGNAVVPEKKRGNWGVGAKWAPEFLKGTSIGAYYRKFDEKAPWVFADPTKGYPFSYRTVYPRNTELWGLSLDTTGGPLSIGAELAYRKNTALQTPFLSPLNEDGGARGNTWHAVANAIYLMPSTPLWDTGVLVAEINYSSLDKVTKNEAVYAGVGRAACTNPISGAVPVAFSGDKNDGCATKDAWGISISFTPQWPQAFTGVDLSLPIVAGYGIRGNDAAIGGGSNEGAYNYSIGLEADVFQKTKVKLAYNDYGGKISRMAGSVWGSINGSNNPSALLHDRGWLSLTVKTSF